MKMLQIIVLFLLCALATPPALRGQYKPKVELGSIMSTELKKSQSGQTPLRVNDGDASFFNKWVVFLGAQLNDNLSLYAEVQTLNGIRFTVYGLSAIYHSGDNPWLNVEVGKFLVPFGNFLERRWASENPFMDFPLIYEYRTGVSAFDIPHSNSELLRVRGRGASFEYHDDENQLQKQPSPRLSSGHIPRAGSGLRILSREVYLTGFQFFGIGRVLKYYVGATNGALSNPADINNSNGIQVHGRVALTPRTGLEIGASASSGAYLNKATVQADLDLLGQDAESLRQKTVGVDVRYAYAHFMFFSEVLFNRWDSPFISDNLDATAFYIEGKYRWLTRFYTASRFSYINFSQIADPQDVDGDGRLRESWDFDVYQLELASGFYLNRNALAKFLYQINKTVDVPAGDPDDNLLAVQMVVFF